MNRPNTRSLSEIERKMEHVEESSIRYQILNSAKNFKTSWVDLGQALYSVWKDKLYKDWGFTTFDLYTSREIGIKKMTAMKLLKSYYFLEKEEPLYLNKDYKSSDDVAIVPNYDTVNVLRLAKNKKILDKDDYARLREYVFEMGKDATEVKKDLTSLMKQREELEPDEARAKRRMAVIKRMLTALKTLKADIEASKMLPANILKETASLISKIEAEIT